VIWNRALAAISWRFSTSIGIVAVSAGWKGWLITETRKVIASSAV